MKNLSGTKIAVIDDTDSILMLFEALLQVHGADVCTSNCGEDFLTRVEDIAPDLILLDIQMPGLTGYDVLQRLKSIDAIRETPVVALTAHAMSGDKEKILESGFTAYIAKPIDTRAFPEQVAAFLKTSL